MVKKLNLAKAILLTVLLFCMPIMASAEDAKVVDMPAKSGVSIIKPWTVKFNLELDKSTVNSKNIYVMKQNGGTINATVLPGEDANTIIVCPPTGGYIPGSKYILEVSTNVKSKSGKNLSKATIMNFTTSNQYEDSSNYENLPSINGVEVVQKPVLQNSSTSFKVTPNSKGDVQYRVFAFKYPDETYDNPNTYYSKASYTELSNGYSKTFSGSEVYNFVKPEGFGLGKYKIIVYVKTAGKTGKYKDENTDFDNYYSTYFRVIDKNITVDKPSNSTIEYVNYDKTLDEYAASEYKDGAPTYSESTGWMRASKEIIKYYMNPYNFIDDNYKFQFLNLNYMEVSASDLNKVLQGKGVLAGKGEVFLQAAKENNINPIYLVAHALLETGNGTSALATGIKVTSVDGVNVKEPKVVYNMFGIQATDANPNKYGSEYAYKQGWFTADQAILGGAKYIGTDYINNPKYNQNTLYKMRWNYIVRWHQYATDIGWARKQINRINFAELMEQASTAKCKYTIPQFK